MYLKTPSAFLYGFSRHTRVTQQGDSSGNRFVQRSAALSSFAQGAHAMLLLGQVDEMKIHAESPHQLQQAII
jgi:hypothetical protein